MTIRLNAIAAIAAALFASGALAASFSEVDSDGDGAITLNEAQAAMPDLTTEAFLSADANADGALSEEEFAVLSQA